MRKMQFVVERGGGGPKRRRICTLCRPSREVAMQAGQEYGRRNGAGALLLYRLPRMLYILLPESRQAASRSRLASSVREL